MMEWQARWIWARSQASTPNFYLYARREFDVAGPITARIFVTCSSEYKLYVNGRHIGRGPSPPDQGVQQYDEYDITHAIRPGRNVIAALCYNYGVETSYCPQAPGGFLLQAELSNSLETLGIGSDETWKVKPADDWDSGSARMSPTTGFQEACDTRKKPVGWNVVGFDDSTWDDAHVLGKVDTELVPRDIPALREHEVFAERVVSSAAVQYAKSALNASGETAVVAPGQEASITLDFGRVVVGFPVIRVRDGSPTLIDIGYDVGDGNRLLRDPDDVGGVSERRSAGDVSDVGGVSERRSSGDGGDGSRLLQADRVIVHGGRQEWETFGRRAFRYVQLTFSEATAPLLLESVSVRKIGYPVEQVSMFECSDESLNEAWREGVYDLSLAMQDSYECCPLRQIAQDPAGAAAQALANYYSFFDTALAARALRGFAASPDSSLAWISMLHDYHLYTGDRSLVHELFPSVKSAIERNAAGEYQVLRDAAKLAIACAAIDESVEWMAAAEEVGHESDALTEATPFTATYSLPAEILGVKPSMPESGVVVIQPRPGDLQWAKGHITTHSSSVDVEWTSEPGLFRMDINAPEGFIAALPISGFRNPKIDEVDLSPETPERRARRSYGWTDTIWRDGEEHDPYVDWLETQESEPPAHYQRRKRLSTEEQYVWVRESVVTHVRYEIREGPAA